MTFKKHCLVFSFDENIEINVTPDGENKYIVTFESGDTQNNAASTVHLPVSIPETLMIESQAEKDVQKTEAKHSNKPKKLELPEYKEVVEFLKSFENYTHNNSQIQEHFFGRALHSKAENYFYQRFAIVVRKARETIAEKEGGYWKELDRADLGNNRHLKTFTFVKNPEQHSIQELI